MSLVEALPAPSFGAGGGEPYERALREGGAQLFLHDSGDESPRTLDLARWTGPADPVDLAVLRNTPGPLLDVGCGPGRMVRAALGLGTLALGIDISPAAIGVARGAGLPVLERSVFAHVPRAGDWRGILLVDGNLGIGGDVESLLARCAELLARDGEIVVETHPDTFRDERFTARLTDDAGHVSSAFPWAEMGIAALTRTVARLGLAVRQSVELDGRVFCRLVLTTR